MATRPPVQLHRNQTDFALKQILRDCVVKPVHLMNRLTASKLTGYFTSESSNWFGAIYGPRHLDERRAAYTVLIVLQQLYRKPNSCTDSKIRSELTNSCKIMGVRLSS